MTEDLIHKTLTGLMLEQRAMTDSQKSLTKTLKCVVKTQESLAQASARQESRFGDLLTVMQSFAQTSADTRQRLLTLEAEVEKLKNAS